MKILRLGIEDHQITIILYRDGKKMLDIHAATVAELSKKIIIGSDVFSDLSGIYVYRGPGGYSKLRAIWAFAHGLSLSKIPVEGYSEWSNSLSVTLPLNANQSILYGDTIK